jgi:hypothetical protein
VKQHEVLRIKNNRRRIAVMKTNDLQAFKPHVGAPG